MYREQTKGPLVTTRTAYLDPERARDDGTRRVMVPDEGAPYTVEMVEAMVEQLVGRGFRRDLLITVHPVGLTPQNLARKVSRLLGYYREWWGKRHAVGPEREPVWFDFVIATALTGDRHESHAHVVLDVDLTAADIVKLENRAKKWNVPLEVTRNSAAWLSRRPNVSEHRCKVEYTIEHMLRAGSVMEIGETDRLEFVARSKAAFRTWTA
jgi:hypothetical protein